MPREDGLNSQYFFSRFAFWFRCNKPCPSSSSEKVIKIGVNSNLQQCIPNLRLMAWALSGQYSQPPGHPTQTQLATKPPHIDNFFTFHFAHHLDVRISISRTISQGKQRTTPTSSRGTPRPWNAPWKVRRCHRHGPAMPGAGARPLRRQGADAGPRPTGDLRTAPRHGGTTWHGGGSVVQHMPWGWVSMMTILILLGCWGSYSQVSSFFLVEHIS